MMTGEKAVAPTVSFWVVSGNALSRAEWTAKARKAEALGYATFLVPDHITIGVAPLTALRVAAEATATLRIMEHLFTEEAVNFNEGERGVPCL